MLMTAESAGSEMWIRLIDLVWWESWMCHWTSDLTQRPTWHSVCIHLSLSLSLSFSLSLFIYICLVLDWCLCICMSMYICFRCVSLHLSVSGISQYHTYLHSILSNAALHHFIPLPWSSMSQHIVDKISTLRSRAGSVTCEYGRSGLGSGCTRAHV